MDFKVWCWYHGKRYRIYDPEANIGVDNPSLSLSVNEAGELSFVIHPTHAAYDLFNVSMISQSPILYRVKVRVTLGALEVFHGRLYAYSLNDDNSITVKFEGDLAILSDSIMRPTVWGPAGNLTVNRLIRNWIKYHNANTGALQQITFLGGGESVSCPVEAIDNYNDALTQIKTYILGEVGGYLVTDYVQGGSDFDSKTFNETEGTVYLSYEQTHDRHSSRPLRANLLSDFSADYDGSDFYNCIVPVGAKGEAPYITEDVEGRLHIGVYNYDYNGEISDRILKDSTDTEFIREKVVEWSEETDESKLRNLGTNRLASDYAQEIPEITIKALDPDFLPDSSAAFSDYRLLDWVTVFDEIHGIQGEYQIVSIDYDIGNPTNSRFTLSASGSKQMSSYAKKYSAQIKALEAGQFNTRCAKSILEEVTSSS